MAKFGRIIFEMVVDGKSSEVVRIERGETPIKVFYGGIEQPVTAGAEDAITALVYLFCKTMSEEVPSDG